MSVSTEDFLSHYGVKGMKWGVRRDKELAAKRKSAKREAEAKEYDKLARNYNARLKDLTSIPNHDKSEAKWLTSQRDKAKRDAESARSGEGLSPKQKQLLKGVAIAGGVLAAYGAYRVVNSGEMNRQIMKGKALLEGRGDIPFLKNDDLTGTMTSNQIIPIMEIGLKWRRRAKASLAPCRLLAMPGGAGHLWRRPLWPAKPPLSAAWRPTFPPAAWPIK